MSRIPSAGPSNDSTTATRPSPRQSPKAAGGLVPAAEHRTPAQIVWQDCEIGLLDRARGTDRSLLDRWDEQPPLLAALHAPVPWKHRVGQRHAHDPHRRGSGPSGPPRPLEHEKGTSLIGGFSPWSALGTSAACVCRSRGTASGPFKSIVPESVRHIVFLSDPGAEVRARLFI